MKKILLLISIVLLIAAEGFSQAPGILNYQGVARNSVGNVLVNKNITLRLTIRDNSAAGPTVYQETRGVTTNPFGLFNVQLGSPGASGITGTIAGVPWGVGLKFIQVEIDPNGGSSFINIGTAQLASVPYSLYSNLSGDLVLPFNKTQADAGTLFKITNSGNATGSTALEGLTNSTAGNANAIIGTVTSAGPGGFSAGVRGINNGTGGLGIGVYGSQAGSGWGVYGTTPSGIGVNGNSTSGFGIFGSSTSGVGVYGTSSTSNGGLFEVTNTSSTADALRATTAGTGASWAIRGISSGTNGAGLFQQTNATNTSNNLQSNQAGLGRAGLFNITNAANAGNAVEINTNGALASKGLVVSHTGLGAAAQMEINNPASVNNVLQINNFGLGRGALIQSTNAANNANIIDAFNAGPGWVMNITSSNATPKALQTQGALRHSGLGEANNFVLRSDATGNATWVDPALLLPGANFWTRVGTNMWNTNLGDNVGVGTNAPGYRFDVLHGGATGIRSKSSAGFSVMDIDGFSGDAALRFYANGASRWNMRNRPSDDALEFFSLKNSTSRMIIQDATGNVGIGNTVNPTYRLDVQHGGGSGLHVQSTASFSVIDLDAANGDAALRYQTAGVTKWNVRNAPGNDDYQIVRNNSLPANLTINNGTGFVGITQATPAYQLDVLHAGATGIRSQSSSTFSVIDIDAANGDAALRFQKAGAGKWNTRNRPADDNYEIFQLGGGGSRMTIASATGFVGMGGPGATASPAYQLDVEHVGATGIRSKSTGTFSVVDIDAANGDAALRFQKAGTGKWNTRNEPIADDYQWFELGGGGERMRIQRGTGYVGINQPAPTHQLDVVNGGGTGILSQSTSTFSVVDIDGFNGDAALRFYNNGTGRWNTRNNPAAGNPNSYQIFDLTNAVERMNISSVTGHVGIGGIVPAYRLDVAYGGGASGFRIKSTAGFSVNDIDAFNGDAALRFYNNGAGRWNVRNNPAGNSLQFFDLSAGAEMMRIDAGTGKVWVNNDFTVLGVKAFTMDHPLDPANKTLMHAAAESNEVINFYSGNITTDASGKAIVSLPDYYEALNKDSRYQLTVIGSFAQAIISKEVSNNQFEIATSVPNVKVSWEVKGVRSDAHMKQHPFVAVEEKSAEQRGKYIDPAAYNLPASKGISYDANLSNSLQDVKLAPAKASAPEQITGSSLEAKTIAKPVASKEVVNNSSLEAKVVAKPAAVPVDKSGSIAPQTEVKKADVKPVDVKGTSVENVPLKKPVEEQKKKSDVAESTKTE